MPYIKKEQRERIADGDIARTAGEVNYLVTLLMNSYLDGYDSANDIAEGIEYTINDLINKEHCIYGDFKSEFHKELATLVMESDVDISKVVGALRNAFAEFYARKVRPYEDIKIKENGDV